MFYFSVDELRQQLDESLAEYNKNLDLDVIRKEMELEGFLNANPCVSHQTHLAINDALKVSLSIYLLICLSICIKYMTYVCVSLKKKTRTNIMCCCVVKHIFNF